VKKCIKNVQKNSTFARESGAFDQHQRHPELNLMKKCPGLVKSRLGELTEKHKHFSII